MSEGTAALDAGPVGDAVDAAVAVHRDEPGALLEILHAVQAELGWLPPATTRAGRRRLNLSRAEVHGVITFYKDFRTEPAGRLDRPDLPGRGVPGASAPETLADHAREQRLGVGSARPPPTARSTLEQVFCLGNCALGPAVEVDGVLHGRVDAARLDALLDGRLP